MSNDIQNVSWPGWETIKLIGQGGFGTVYEIQREIFGNIEKAALKVISLPQNNSDIEELYNDGYDLQSITNMFQNHLKNIVTEYSLMRKMNGSGNIVNCDDVRYVQHNDGIGWDIFIKMEILTPLTHTLPTVPSEKTVIQIAKDMCTALDLCKKYEIIHRDIKPQNIFVSSNGDYKLGDFGIAKTVEKTMSGTKIGTYRYMAPEIYNNQPYGNSADIYSLGLSLYWMLNERRLPFLPLPPTKLSVSIDEAARNRRLSGESIPAPAHGSDNLTKIVLKACAYNVKDRYGSAAEMLKDLNQLNFSEKETPTIPKCTNNTNIQDQTLKVQNSPNHVADQYSSTITVNKPARKQQTASKTRISDDEYDNPSYPLKSRKTLQKLLAISGLIILIIVVTLFQKSNHSDNLFNKNPVLRIYGEEPCDTSMIIANMLKNIWEIDRFDNIILVDSEGTSAAFNASYLANVKKAPILLVNQNDPTDVIDYIKSNLHRDGTLYLLGSTNVIAEDLKATLPDYTFVLLYGANRYETNTAILEEIGIDNEEILVCNAENYGLGISAAATKKPVLLVGKTLTENQKMLLSENSCQIVLLGNNHDFSSELETELEKYDENIEHIGGTNFYEITINIAKRFFDNPNSIALAYDMNYEDSLCGGPLAATIGAPIVFIDNSQLQYAIDYVNENELETGIIFGSPNLIKDKTVDSIFEIPDNY